MEFEVQNKKYTDFIVYNVTKIKNKYGFRIVLIYDDVKNKPIQKSGYKTKKEANNARNTIITELTNGTFVIYDNVNVKTFFTYWLEKVMKPNITDASYDAYKNIVYNHIIPKYETIKMATLNRGHIQKLYNDITQYSHSVARICKTVINTALNYAQNKNIIRVNVAIGVNLPKCIKKQEYRTRKIDIKKTLTEQQVKTLIEKSKETPIHMQILFAVLMGLRKGEINGLKYTDIDYIHRTVSIQRQLGKKANTSNTELKKGEYTKQEIKVKTFSSNRIDILQN